MGCLIRLIEILGVEYGLYDPLARENAFFGMLCFLKHATTFDEFLWHRMANALARMNIYFGGEVAHFLARITDEHRECLQVRMNQVLPRKASAVRRQTSAARRSLPRCLLKPAGKKDGLRVLWMDCLPVLLGPQSMSATLRHGAKKLLELIQGGSSPSG